MAIEYDDDETRLLAFAYRLAIEVVEHRDINMANMVALDLRDFAEGTFGEDQRAEAMRMAKDGIH